MSENVRYDVTGDGWLDAAEFLEELVSTYELDDEDTDAVIALATKIRDECAFDPGGSRTVAVDFDGVLHAYSKGWHTGDCYDEPLAGAAEGLAALALKYRVVVFTARDSLTDVRAWLEKHGLAKYVTGVTGQKPSAVAYLDDRAVCFDPTGADGCGWWTALSAVDELVERKRRRPA